VPSLSNNAIRQRLEYTERHIDDLFTNVVFNDEAMFQLSENRTLNWWNPDSEESPAFEDNHKKSKEGSGVGSAEKEQQILFLEGLKRPQG